VEELIMICGRPTLAVLVALMIAACSACGSAPPTSNPSPIGNTVSPKPTAGTDLEATNSPRSPSPAPTPLDSPDPTPVPVAPKPTGVSFEERRVGDEAPTTEITQTVKWGEPASEGLEIRVFGVTECVAKPPNPSPDTHGACLAEDMPLPASVRTLLATAPASDGVVSWTWTGTFDCEIGLGYDPRGPAYHAVVLAAYGGSGHSIFAIAEAGEWWEPGPDDIVC
jgi:hypothetical protein